MHSQSVAVAAACLLALTSASPVQKRDCTSPYVVYARGTDPNGGTSSTQPDSDPTDAALQNIANQGLPGAYVQALSYPASGIVAGTDYFTSWGTGIDNLQGLIRDTVDACPSTKFVLLGYSQGASVITGSLMGGQGRPALAQEYLDAVAGGVAIADPSFVPGLNPLDNQSTNTDTPGKYQDGSVQTDLNTAFQNRFASLCSSGDEFCANAYPNGGDIHDGAEGTWSSVAISFLQGLSV